MIEAFLGRVLLRRPETLAARIAWAVFLIAGPLAYLGGALLEQRGIARDSVVMAPDRAAARATSQQFAAAHGIDSTRWTPYASIEPSEDLLEYFQRHHDPAAEAAQSFSSPVSARVLLNAGDGDRAQMVLDRTGRIYEFDFTHLKSLTAGPLIPEDQAAAIARDSLAQVPNLTRLVSLGRPAVSSLDRVGKGCREFAWHPDSASLPDLSFDMSVAVCGSTPVRRTIHTKVDESYAAAQWGRAARPLKVLKGLYWLYIVIVVIYAIYRYASRSLEREVSHRRTILVALIVGSGIAAAFLTALDEYVFGLVKAGQGILWYPLIVVGITFLLTGLLIAVAYGAGEGDLREAYPGKMTSLDAFLRGRFFSRNVGRSALFGIAFAAWTLLAEGLADWAFPSGSGRFAADLMKLPFLRYPLVAVFAGQAITVALIPTAGLLLPLAFLGRRVKRPRLRTGLMVLFAVCGCMMDVNKYGNLASAAVGTAVLTAILLGAFFGMDLLAVIFGLGAFEVATALARLTALSPGAAQLGLTVAAMALAFLALETWAALRGREYRDEEVRPQYAGNIAARQLMQAELAAAREAQLHLLPKCAPEIHGLYITAACVPARIVGGDFYDFYPLGDGRLGIFIAEGGNRGIGSALNIALAKGFLMHTVRRGLSPREVIQRLESTLGPLLEGAGAGTTPYVAFAILDTAAATIRWARTGEFPRVALPTLSAEQRVELPGSDTVILEGSAPLRTGDTVLLFTDGIARRVRTSGPAAADNILKALSRKRREHELEDDLTAVVVRITRATQAMEGVA